MKYRFDPHKQRGISLIWVVLTFMLMFAILGLMLDWAYVYVVGHQLQNTADAAALAGSRYVADPNSPSPGQSAREKAQEYANDNYADHLSVNLNTIGETSTEVPIYMSSEPEDLWPLFNDGDVYIGRYVDDTRLFIKNDPYPDSMLVVTRKMTGQANDPLPLLFAPVVTVFYGADKLESAGIRKYAVAKIKNPYGAGVLALGECDCPGIIFGSTDPDDPAITIFGGGTLYVNSPNENAVDQSGNADVGLDIDGIYVVGDVDPFFDNPEDTNLNIGADPEPDPYANLPDAVYSTTPDLGTITASGTYEPGYYSGGIQVTDSGASITLQPGNYYLDSIGEAASLYMLGGLVTGEGVTLHIIGDADYGVNISGNANLDISAPTSGTYADIGIFQKRDPDYDCSISCAEPWSKTDPISVFTGTGTIIIDGVVYMPTTRLELGGTGYIEMTRTIADRIYIYGSSQKIVNYRGDPEVATKSYLVE